MQVTSVDVYRTFSIEIEHEGTTYIVNAHENMIDWDFTVIDVDNCEDVEDEELYDALVEAAEEAIKNA